MKSNLTSMNISKNLSNVQMIIESGCSKHISNLAKDSFNNYQHFKTVFGTASSSASIISPGIGDIGPLRSVRHCPELSKNLLSVSQLCDDYNTTILFNSSNVSIFPMGTVQTLTNPLVSGPRVNGIYTINLDLKSESLFSNPFSEQA